MPDSLYFETLTDHNLQDFLNKSIVNPLSGTPLENYAYIQPRTKGAFGELYIKEVCKRLDYQVKDRTDAGNDAIINDIKTEIKFSVLSGKYFRFNHIAKSKDYDRLIFACYYNLNIDIKYCTKDTVCTLIDNGVFKRQQNGKKGTNDDYMFVPKLSTWQEFIQQDFIKDLRKW